VDAKRLSEFNDGAETYVRKYFVKTKNFGKVPTKSDSEKLDGHQKVAKSLATTV